MTVATDLINSALKQLNVAGVLSPPTPDQQSVGFDVLKSLIESMEQNEINLNLNLPYEINDDLDEPAWSKLHLINILSERLAPYFPGSNLSLELKSNIRESWESLQIHGVTRTNPAYPTNQPLGQGNRNGPQSRTFYSGNDTAS